MKNLLIKDNDNIVANLKAVNADQGLYLDTVTNTSAVVKTGFISIQLHGEKIFFTGGGAYVGKLHNYHLEWK